MPRFTRIAVLLLLVAPSCSMQSLQLGPGAPVQPGWITDARTGCKVWDPAPLRNETVAWSGECQNGVARGRGVLQRFQDGKPIQRVEEEFYANGDHYEGETIDGKPTGHGIYTYANGNRYEGEFRDGKWNGRGIATFADGSRYEGEFHDDVLNGQGVITLANGTLYKGEFRGGKLNGQGVITYPSGAVYTGEFRDDMLNGHGAVTSASGTLTKGEFRDGKLIDGANVAATQATPKPPALGSPNRGEIRLAKVGGVLVVPVRINGAITLNFLIDSGATDVSIPVDVVSTLLRTGTLTDGDFLGKQTYRLADGSTVPSETFRIRVLKVGDRELENVVGSVADVRSVPLLGQSFLSRFKSWSIDNQRQMLVLE
jgi:hypothetical protein